jgi:hypothetical protein
MHTLILHERVNLGISVSNLSLEVNRAFAYAKERYEDAAAKMAKTNEYGLLAIFNNLIYSSYGFY